MATVSFSPAGETLYAFLAGEIDHDAAQSLRIQLDDALVSRSPRTMILDFGGVGFMPARWVRLCGYSIPRRSWRGCCSWRRSPAWMQDRRRNEP